MSRRIDLLKQLIASNKFGDEKENEQRFLAATAQLILTDLINQAIKGVEASGAGSLILNISNTDPNQQAVYVSGNDIQFDIALAESNEDENTIKFLRQLMEEVDKNDWSKNVLITLISDAGTRTFAVEAGGSQESLRALTKEFTG
mgnify:CR=1 FL=1|tara:strand:- start:1137 stop:1571 length:435 start_codon:yes stop_codon:yes gene_type:complete